jgi:RNA polymerase sigma-70 factor, ECF subfamily
LVTEELTILFPAAKTALFRGIIEERLWSCTLNTLKYLGAIAEEKAMPVTANATRNKIVVRSVARRTLEKRRSLASGTRSIADCIPREPVPPASLARKEKLSEMDIVQRVREGDRTVFEHLYRAHSKRVYALCLRIIGNPIEAEDLTQEAFLLLFRKIHTFRGDSAFTTWLHRLTVNLVLMNLRKKPAPVVSIETTPDVEDGAASQGIDIGAPDLSLEGSIDRINLGRCIAQLPLGYRTMFVLHDIQGYEHHEIARILGRSVGDSKSQLHKARARLRKLLHELRREKTREERLAARKTLSRSSEALLV